MKYTLRRCCLSKRGAIFSELTFDLWNSEYNVGYEIKVTIWKHNIFAEELHQYARGFIGQTLDISKWDLIIRNIKQYRLEVTP